MSALSSPDTEKSILGAILLNGDAYFEAAPLLRFEDFSLDSHRKIYARMVLEIGHLKPLLRAKSGHKCATDGWHFDPWKTVAALNEGLWRKKPRWRPCWSRLRRFLEVGCWV